MDAPAKSVMRCKRHVGRREAKLLGEAAGARVIAGTAGGTAPPHSGLIVDHEDEKTHARPALADGCSPMAAATIQNSVNSPGYVSTSIEPPCSRTMMSWLSGEARSPFCTLADGLRREERIGTSGSLHFGRDARAVVADPDFRRYRRGSWSAAREWAGGRLHSSFRFALRSGIGAIGDQVEQHPRNLLREDVSASPAVGSKERSG